MALINDYLNTNQEKLALYTTAITRAHGKNHPEAFTVRELYTKIDAKVKAAGTDKPDLAAEFEKLREVTDHYTVPGDVCETYEAVYKSLEEADRIYSA
ncbi:iron-sulfur cluster repair di-iron protein, ric [Jeotgalibaca porci]|uniref:iron-sulfur cluster repair di-iron protein, ric n=1 Tax=Jeotgalibaca porci TaxID=1868793 RepID=UPI003F8F50AA